MPDLTITIPADSLIGAKIPPRELELELRRRLAATLYSDGIISGAAACRMASMEKSAFQNMLGERGVCQPLGETDFRQDRENLREWKTR